MACVKKLDKDILFDCANVLVVGGVGSIDELILLNSDDISAISIDSGVGVITMQTGTKGFVVDSIKNSVQYTDAIRTSDIAPNMEEHTLVIKLMSTSVSAQADYCDLRQKLLLGNYRAAVKSTSADKYFLIGGLAGLEASDMATDSATDGITSITLKTPDAAAGDVLAGLSKAGYDKLKTAAT